MQIRLDNLRSEQIIGLLNEHLQSMVVHSPPESVHALDLEALRQGKASALLQHILGEARQHAYRRLSLETGSAPASVSCPAGRSPTTCPIRTASS